MLNAVAAVPKANTLYVIICLEFFRVPLLRGLIVQIILLMLLGHRDGFSHFLVLYLLNFGQPLGSVGVKLFL